MTRTVPKGAAMALACLALLYLTAPAAAVRHHRPRVFCAPVVIEGAGTVRICALARTR